MANTTIQIKRSGTALSVPSAVSLANGELALNFADEKLYFKNSNGVVRSFSTTGGTASPGGLNREVQFNDAGSLGGNSAFTFDKANARLSITDINASSAYFATNLRANQNINVVGSLYAGANTDNFNGISSVFAGFAAGYGGASVGATLGTGSNDILYSYLGPGSFGMNFDSSPTGGNDTAQIGGGFTNPSSVTSTTTVFSVADTSTFATKGGGYIDMTFTPSIRLSRSPEQDFIYITNKIINVDDNSSSRSNVIISSSRIVFNKTGFTQNSTIITQNSINTLSVTANTVRANIIIANTITANTITANSHNFSDGTQQTTAMTPGLAFAISAGAYRF